MKLIVRHALLGLNNILFAIKYMHKDVVQISSKEDLTVSMMLI